MVVAASSESPISRSICRPGGRSGCCGRSGRLRLAAGPRDPQEQLDLRRPGSLPQHREGPLYMADAGAGAERVGREVREAKSGPQRLPSLGVAMTRPGWPSSRAARWCPAWCSDRWRHRPRGRAGRSRRRGPTADRNDPRARSARPCDRRQAARDNSADRPGSRSTHRTWRPREGARRRRRSRCLPRSRGGSAGRPDGSRSGLRAAILAASHARAAQVGRFGVALAEAGEAGRGRGNGGRGCGRAR
jgi:hypothetical protein